MITRFDHAVIAVNDLPRALARFPAELGLDAQPGGRHTGRGTENGIVRFGLDYLELMAVYNADEVAKGRAGGEVLLSLLARQPGGLLGYALATDDIDELAGRVRAAELNPLGPFAMQRERPDGRVLKWRLLIPGGVSWRRPWPFFIQWDAPDAERLAWEQPGQHALGVRGVAGVSVLVRDLAKTRELYRRALGLELVAEDDVPQLAARRARFALGPLTIDLLAADGAGAADTELQAQGEGLFQVTLRGPLAQASAWLAQVGEVPRPAPGTFDGMLLPSAAAFGARLAVAEG
ncbi:MAG TPA: VOC family protein [Dehalococcoidia bacterium]|nr:VOC family protein [Dehalococcoidia bacterium]